MSYRSKHRRQQFAKIQHQQSGGLKQTLGTTPRQKRRKGNQFRLPDVHQTVKNTPEYSLRKPSNESNHVLYLADHEEHFNNQPCDAKNTSKLIDRHPPEGIQNIGNTCYVNSLIQILCQTPSLLEIISNNIKRSKEAHSTVTVTRALQEVLQQDNMSIRIRHFQNIISRRVHDFSIGFQNDCHSYLLAVLDELISEDTAGDVLRLFEIRMKEEFRFGSCSHREVTDVQTLRSLTIPSDSHTVENGLQELLSSEEFDERDVPCRTCKNTGYSKTVKAMKFCQLPLILVLQLGCFREDTSSGSVTYSLFGVVNHHGSIYGGHYTSYVKHLTNREEDFWYYCNDSYVQQISTRDVLHSNEAYLLFYNRNM
uniref:Ubiquitin carboxyl-terminal hydrolase 36 n=1 Tax=Crassostrea virginica TaxID=6565 RepID=A0A8B8ALW0_CRAVI|nr:ubiquitin carboxyl-terminal hydrolase 25-like isoform X2 [Crassostrea virginica]